MWPFTRSPEAKAFDGYLSSTIKRLEARGRRHDEIYRLAGAGRLDEALAIFDHPQHAPLSDLADVEKGTK